MKRFEEVRGKLSKSISFKGYKISTANFLIGAYGAALPINLFFYKQNAPTEWIGHGSVDMKLDFFHNSMDVEG